MSDLIDRQAAIDAIRTYLEDNQVEDADWHANGIEYEIEGLPSAQPQRIKGVWGNYLNEGLRYICSECGSRFTIPWDFCPHCGSYNRGDEDE